MTRASWVSGRPARRWAPLPSAAIGVRLAQYGIFIGATFIASPKPYTPPGSTDLLVADFVPGGGTWTVYLYVNPISFGVPDLVVNVPPVIYGTMVNQNQSGFMSDEFRLGDTAGEVSAAGAAEVPAAWGNPGASEVAALRGIAPNPVRSAATITCEVPRGATARLLILDVRGRLVAALPDDASVEGVRSVRGDATDSAGRRVPPGAYFVRLTSGGVVRTSTLLVAP